MNTAPKLLSERLLRYSNELSGPSSGELVALLREAATVICDLSHDAALARQSVEHGWAAAALAPPSGEVVDVSDDDVWEAHCTYTDVYDGHGSERPAMRAALEAFAKSRQQPIAPDKPNFDETVERLAKFIYRKESLNCKTIDEAMYHQSNWRRAIPEAREMLEAAIGSNLCAFFDIRGNSK